MEATGAAVDIQTRLADRSAARASAVVLVVSVIVGTMVTALHWHVGRFGLAWSLSDVVLLAGVLLGVARGRPGAAGFLLAAANLWLAGSFVVHASDWALITALPGTVATLALLSVVVANRMAPETIDRVGRAWVDTFRFLPRGILEAAAVPRDVVGSEGRRQAGGLLRGTLVGVPLSAFFALLLSADPRFRWAISALFDRSRDAAAFAWWALVTTAASLVAYSVLRCVRRGHEAPSAPPPVFAAKAPYRIRDQGSPLRVESPRPRVGVLAWSVVLTQLLAVFAVYAVVNIRTLFVGDAVVRAPGTITYAGYLHEGFAQVSIAAFLAVTCIAVGHLLLRPRGSVGRIPGGRAVAALELSLLSLVAVALASCAHRLAIYEDAYGYTYQRLGVWLLELAIAGLLALTAARCVARSRREWGAALTWSGVAFALIAGSIDADGWIARRNAERARSGAELDVAYLSTLSEDARSALPEIVQINASVAAVLADDWEAARASRRRLGWRAWRGL